MDQTESVQCRGNLFEENSTIFANHGIEASMGTAIFWIKSLLFFILWFVYAEIDWLIHCTKLNSFDIFYTSD